MSDEKIDPRTVIIDGTTGEVVSHSVTPQRARTAKPTFVGTTDPKAKGVVRTKVIRRYRGLITNRNPPPKYKGPTADQMTRRLESSAEKVGRALGKGLKKGEPPIVTIGNLIMQELIKKLKEPPR